MNRERTEFVVVKTYRGTVDDGRSETERSVAIGKPFKSIGRAVRLIEEARYGGDFGFDWTGRRGRFHIYAQRAGHRKRVATFEPYESNVGEWERMTVQQHIGSANA